jgi:hypothetical protein
MSGMNRRHLLATALAARPTLALPAAASGRAGDVAAAKPAPPPTANRSGLRWASGLTTQGGSGGDIDELRQWEAWRGRKVDIVNLKSRRNDGWEELVRSFRPKAAVYDALGREGVRVSQTMPLWPRRSGSDDPLADARAGAFDRYHKEIAATLAGYRPLPGMVLRLAHESSSGSQQDWMGADPDRVNFAAWKAAWRRIGSVYKEAIPGLLLEWNHIRHPGIDVRGGYPGDDLVDIVGVDSYNNEEEIGDDAGWDEYADRRKGGMPNGPRAWFRYAVGLGKKVSYAEWGVKNTEGADSVRDSARYVRGMWELFRDEAEHLAYECYFNCRGVGEADHRLMVDGETSTRNPRAAAAYRQLWSATG